MTTIRDVLWRATDVPSLLGEIIGAAAVTGAAVHIPHFSSSGGPHVTRMLAMVERARERGLDITVEDYPYAAAMIDVMLFDPPQTDAELQDVEILATGERLNRKTVARHAAAKASAIVHNNWIEPFVVESLRSPVTSIASHGFIDENGRGHPRTSGTFSRVLGH